MKKITLLVCVMALAAVMVFSACSSPSNISGEWTDPATGNTLKMKDGNFTVADSSGAVVDEGTYAASDESDVYHTTLSDGSQANLTVEDKKVVFTDASGVSTVYEEVSATPDA